MAVFSCSATVHPQVVYRNSVTMLPKSINCTLHVSHFDGQRIVEMSRLTLHWQTICYCLLFLDLKEAASKAIFLHSGTHRLRIY